MNAEGRSPRKTEEVADLLGSDRYALGMKRLGIRECRLPRESLTVTCAEYPELPYIVLHETSETAFHAFARAKQAAALRKVHRNFLCLDEELTRGSVDIVRTSVRRLARNSPRYLPHDSPQCVKNLDTQ